MDDSKTTVLVLFDISAAFNTVDHNFLLERLKQCGISGTSGMRIGHLIPRLKGYMCEDTDAVVLHLGTNDISGPINKVKEDINK